MMLKVDLVPPGEEAGLILGSWRNAWGLDRLADGRFRLSGRDPLDVIMDLRDRCYEHGITVEIAFGEG